MIQRLGSGIVRMRILVLTLRARPKIFSPLNTVKILKFFIDLPFRFIFAFFAFTFGGLIGWVGLILSALRFFHVINWPWWVAALPLEYGVLYCLYMTIDGALYRAGLKDIGGYARATATDEHIANAEFQQALRSLERESEKE